MDTPATFRKKARAAAPVVAAIVVFCLIVTLGAMNTALLGRLADLRTAPRDNVQWGLMQVQNESARLQLAITDAIATGIVDRDEIVKRFDILYSRFAMIEEAPIFARLRESPRFKAQVDRGSAEMDRLAAMVDLPADALPGRLPEMKLLAYAFQDDMQAMVLDAIQQFAASSDAERADLSNFIKNMGLAAAALLLVLVFAVIMLLLQGLKLRGRETALLESRNLMAATSSVSLDAIVVCDSGGRILAFNAAAEKCLGHSQEVAMGADMAELMIPERFRDAHRKGMERYLSTGMTSVIGKRIEIEALHADGHEFPVELGIGVTESENGPLFIAYMRDITKRKADDVAMRQALEDAKEGLRTKERFLATISHEIRTPLNGVIGVMDLLRETELTPSQSHYVQIAQQSGEALLSLISDILDVSKMNASGVELLLQPVQLHDIVHDAVETTSVGAAANGNYVTVEIGDGVPVSVVADGNRLRQVMLNLLSNAQKFTKGGEISVSLVRTGGTAGLETVEFSVSDTGPGFDPALAENLFRDFTTLDASNQRESGGSGLGLAISRRIVEAMGGEIGADGHPGVGSRFWFRVSLPPAVAVQMSPPESMATHDRLKILVAEDNSTNLMVTRQMLQSAGHSVDDARNGAEAVERAEAGCYDLILMDISMPRMDGIEATRAIRAGNGPSRSTPVIALTANAVQESVEQALAAGMNNYLSKPIRRADLIAAIDAIVGESRKAMNEPVFDETHYHQLCHDITAQSAREVLQTFLGELAGRHGELRAAKEKGNAIAYGKVCHSIAGAASMVGAAGLSALAHKADSLSKSARPAEALSTFNDMETLIAVTQDVLLPRAAAA